ncbi:MAG: type II toxin-antitoxin system RelE/ParE family toxin [Thermoguttaceae bacterium]
MARKINRCVANLANNPYAHPRIKRLAGSLRGRFRYRVGDWRVVYRVDERAKRVTVLLIAHRGSVYE